MTSWQYSFDQSTSLGWAITDSCVQHYLFELFASSKVSFDGHCFVVMPHRFLAMLAYGIVRLGNGADIRVIKRITPYGINWCPPPWFAISSLLNFHVFYWPAGIHLFHFVLLAKTNIKLMVAKVFKTSQI